MSYSKTADRYEGFVQLCSGYGGYNPGLPNLTVQALRTLMGEARAAWLAKQAARADLIVAINNREAAFDQLPKLVSAISFALATFGAREQTMKDVRVFVRQITGRRKHRNPEPNDSAPEAHSRPGTQLSYDALVQHFTELVTLVNQQHPYAPNEAHLKKEALLAMVDTLRGHNEAVRAARATFSHARVALHQLFYGETHSLVATARTVKKYLRSVYGLNSSEYHAVRKVQFIKYDL